MGREERALRWALGEESIVCLVLVLFDFKHKVL